jgi:hypothetical protein
VIVGIGAGPGHHEHRADQLYVLVGSRPSQCAVPQFESRPY